MIPPTRIEIIGGGLAGLSLGLALRRHGVPATVVEAGMYPRHRVCGEFITGLGAATKARLGLEAVLEDARQHREVAWFLHDNQSRRQTLPEPALGISRHTLDARLAAAFLAAGGTLHTHTRCVERGSPAGRVFATGRRAGRSPWLGLKAHVRGLSLERDLELHLGDEAYVGLCRVEADRVNVCGLFRRRPVSARGALLLAGYLRAAGLARLASRIADAEICAGSFCAVAGLEFNRRTMTGTRPCLGDAYAMIPPFTGNGMAMAFQSAEIALGPLLAYARGETAWPETTRRIDAALRVRFRVRLASAGVLHPFLLSRRRQRWVAALGRTGLLPFGPLYAALH
jgi:menaquinone-9 beta-reductase